MSCQKCNSNRIASINAKCSDLFMVDIPSDNIEYEGYVILFGRGDYVRVRICLDCGQTQGHFPITLDQINDVLLTSNMNREYKL